jgi:4-aminobutyrate aminotransferase
MGDVRGIGLMVGIEVVKDKATREAAPRERTGVIHRAFEKGLLTLPCGSSTIRLSPPLVVREADIDKAVSILDEAFAAAG